MPRRLPPNDPSSRPVARDLSEMFDRAVAGYFWAVDAGEWSAAWEYLYLIDRIHGLSEGLAA